MGKGFEKQTKTIEDQGKKQVGALKDLKPKDKKEKQIEAIEDESDDTISIQKKKSNLNQISRGNPKKHIKRSIKHNKKY